MNEQTTHSEPTEQDRPAAEEYVPPAFSWEELYVPLQQVSIDPPDCEPGSSPFCT